MADAVGGRRIAPVPPIDFEETRDLAHINPIMRQPAGRRNR